MSKLISAFVWCLIASSAVALAASPDTVITGATFDWSTEQRRAPGSDNWPMTWADDGHQYSSWGDGGGFNGTNENCRVSLGVARIEGNKDNYATFNVWGCNSSSSQCEGAGPKSQCAAESPATFKGKSYGMLSVDHDKDGKTTLWMWNMVQGQYFNQSELYFSDNHGATWESVGWKFVEADCAFAVPTFINMGQNYGSNIDGYIYVYAPDGRCDKTSSPPGGMADMANLARARVQEIGNRAAYEFFAGLDGNGQPQWTQNISQRGKAFWYDEDQDGTVDKDKIFWAFSVTYNPGLGVYVLFNRRVPHAGATTSRTDLDLWEASNPWGPWKHVQTWVDWVPGESVTWWFPAPKWFSADGKKMVVVFAGANGYDSWNTIEATLSTVPDSTRPNPPIDLRVQ